MLIGSFTIYPIPGWGFSSQILNPLATNRLNIVGLDYFNTQEPSLGSIGGLIAIKMAALFPKKVRKLILVSSQPKFLSNGFLPR